MHIAEDRLQRFADGASTPSDGAAIQQHLDRCAACVERLVRLRQEDLEVSRMLGLLDAPAPAVRADDVIARARRTRHRRARWAAVAAGLLVAGSAAALLFSPALERARGPGPGPSPTGDAGAASASGSGVAFVPGAATTVDFRAWQTTGRVEIVLSDGGAVEVDPLNAQPSFSLSRRGVTVHNKGASGSYRVLLPRSTSSATVRVEGVVVFQKQGEGITTLAARQGDRFIVQLTRPSTTRVEGHR